ncbi:competence protein ComJ [Pseudomonas salmasensis]|uniref:competence protein ComJ n=1 Tax=Pseudomonas salmasensis TaxID=2745514 RepID=UPI00164959B7|nr:competence protein ComJ [Pseudomonas salmasensis]QXH76122.1 competence protein ComJ [Pseudomonas salmasensis]
MARFREIIYLSYSQFCVFLSSLDQPYNDWSVRSYAQGFAWRLGSVSFRALVDEGYHIISLFINEQVPAISADVVRAFKVPFSVIDRNIEVGSISSTVPLELPEGDYSLQVEFIRPSSSGAYEINVHLNLGGCDFEVLRADAEIDAQGEFDIGAVPAG